MISLTMHHLSRPTASSKLERATGRVKEGFSGLRRATRRIVATGSLFIALTPLPLLAAKTVVPTAEPPVWQTQLTLAEKSPDLLASAQPDITIEKTESRYEEEQKRLAAERQKQLARQRQLKAQTATVRVIAPSTSYHDLITQYFPSYAVSAAERIVACESGGNPNAVGGAWTGIPSYGLFQIRALPGRPAPASLVEPQFNVAYAANLYKSSGWGPWTCASHLGIK